MPQTTQQEQAAFADMRLVLQALKRLPETYTNQLWLKAHHRGQKMGVIVPIGGGLSDSLMRSLMKDERDLLKPQVRGHRGRGMARGWGVLALTLDQYMMTSSLVAPACMHASTSTWHAMHTSMHCRTVPPVVGCHILACGCFCTLRHWSHATCGSVQNQVAHRVRGKGPHTKPHMSSMCVGQSSLDASHRTFHSSQHTAHNTSLLPAEVRAQCAVC